LEQAQRLLAQLSTSATLHQAVELEWRRFISGDAFRDVPPPLPPTSVGLDGIKEIALDPLSRFEFVETGASQLAIISNGLLWTVPLHGRLANWLAELRDGGSLQVDNLIEQAQAADAPELCVSLANLLAFLVASRAVRP
jgi:hypothetical protein